MRLYTILKKPVITEKTSSLELKNNSYVFVVSKDATKIDIKTSVFKLYWVNVASVNIVNVREKFKHWRKRWMQIKRSSFKKAYVTLKDDKAKIDFSVVK